MRQILILLTAMLWLVPGANAENGVLEINHACANNTGCFAGDPAGLPVQIVAAGSYRLTSNLVVSGPNKNGIVVSAPDVSIDLNGFAILRSGCEVSCAILQGGGFGITASPSGAGGMSVTNGSVIGMGAAGIFVGPRGTVRNVQVRLNGFRGVDAGTNSAVSDNLSYQNNSHGIFAGAGSTITNNTAHENGGHGIAAGDGVTISGIPRT